MEEINLRLGESAQQFFGIARHLLAATAWAGSGASCGVRGGYDNAGGGAGRGGAGGRGFGGQQQGRGTPGRGQFMPAAGAGGGGGAAGAGGGGGAAGGFARLPPMQQAAELEKACSHSHVPYFASCTLNMWVNRPDGGNGGGGGFGKKRKGGSGGGGSRKGWGQGGGGDSDMDDGDDGPSTSAPKASYYLIVPNVRNRVKHSRLVSGIANVDSTSCMIPPSDRTKR